MGKKITKIPRGAMRFVDRLCDASAFSEEGDESKKLKMTIYSGKVIRNHFYWDDLAIDLSGLSFQSKKLPILADHDTSKKIAYSIDVNIDNENGVYVNPDKTFFVDTEESREFQNLSKNGFPYQASISVSPSKIQRLEKDEVAEVNGFQMKGPGTIFRNAQVNEGSVCVFGWDSKTQSTAFSKEEVDVDIDIIGFDTEGGDTPKEINDKNELENKNGTNEEVKEMPITREELAKDNPDLLASIENDVKEKVTSELKAKHESEKEELNKKVKEGDDRAVRLEKREVLRTEDENKLRAKVVVSDLLSKSDVPEHLFSKVHNMFTISDFTVENEDGFYALDKEKFTKAVKDEIPSWESKEDTGDNIDGLGFGNKEQEDEASFSKEDDALTTDLSDELLVMSGQDKE